MWGVRPTVFLNEWPTQDQELAVATILHDRSLCPGCHFPKSEVWVDPSDARYDYLAEEVKCLACGPLESERTGSKTEKGLHYYPVRRPLSGKQRTPAVSGRDDDRRGLEVGLGDDL